MGEPKGGSLNTLLKYRFVKKPSDKLSPARPNQCNGSSRENSFNSTDSQATIPYASQTSVGSNDSQATIITTPVISDVYSLTKDKDHRVDSNGMSQVKNNISGGATPSSPIFGSKTNSCGSLGNVKSTDSSSSSAAPLNNADKSAGPWLSTQSTKAQFKRIKRPDPDSDDDDNVNRSGVAINEGDLERLKKLFPDGSVNRMRAALILYPRDFGKAVKFIESDPASPKAVKRPLDSSGGSPSGEKQYKRIKVMPQSPSPPHGSTSTTSPLKAHTESSTGTVNFLKGCFPSKSIDHIRQVLAANNGDADKASIALTNEDSNDARLAQSLIQKPTVQPSNGAGNVTMKQKIKNHKAKRKEVDMSDDEDEEEYDDDYESGDSEDSEDWDNRTKSDTDNFLQFFEEASIEELTAMPGCSKKKAEIIMSLRPFESWDALCEKFEMEKTLSTSIISGCKEIMQVRNTVRRLMVRCENISEQMGKVVSQLTAEGQGPGKTSSNDTETAQITKQPALLTEEFKLQPYQLIGLSWLRLMHEQELNGILADEMGLGKTIQAIAFLAHLMEEGEEGPHVIIVPSSTIENWLREIQRWCPTLKVIVYYGSQEERRAVRHSVFFQGEEFNVLLTTYNMATGGVEDRVLFKKFQFHYAIFDEGHMLKNMSSLRFQNLMKIAAERRLLLTGTPLQNNLLELMSLLCFVMPEIFQGKTEPLKKVFAMISRSEDKKKSRFEKDRIAQAKRIMKPFVLRRLKRDVLQQLPKKTEQIIRCQLIPEQRELYDSIMSKYAEEVSENPEASSTGGVGIFMQFRKAANHPMLLRNLYTDDMLSKMAKKIATEPSHRERGALPKLIQEDMSVMNDFELLGLCKQYKKHLGKFELDSSVISNSAKFRMLDELLPKMKEKGDRVLLFSQFTMMLDIVELFLQARDFKYLRMDGQTPVPDRLQLIDRFNNEQDIFIFLLSTRAGGVGINLAAANTIILHDIDFNPYNDKQAEDRCHRLGQKREVNVVRLICEDTVDEVMLRCANDKLALEKDLTGSTNEEDSENTKDLALMLKEILKAHQTKDAENSQGSETKAGEGTSQGGQENGTSAHS